MKDNSIKLTVIILDYMKAGRVAENVKLLVAQEATFRFKIIVIDNSCNKENAEILRSALMGLSDVELIINKENVGYSRAHNLVKEKIEGEYLLILNPDVLLKDVHVLQKMIEYMDVNQSIGVLGPKQINDTGEIAMTVRAFPRFYLQVARRTFLRYLPILKKRVAYDEMKHLDYSKIQDVDWLQSSCILVRKFLWDKIGGFNELYHLFMADPELCYNSWKNNFRVVYFPEVYVVADGKRVSAGGFIKFFQSSALRQHVVNAIVYNFKHFFKFNPRKKYYKNIQKKLQ